MGHKPDQRARKRRRDREAKKAGMTPERTAMLKALKRRRKANLNIVRVDNASLRACEPMYYYCRLCGAEMKLSEDHDPPAPSHCDDCFLLREQGWNDAKLDFSNEVRGCRACGGKGRYVYPGFGERVCQTCGGRCKIIIEPRA